MIPLSRPLVNSNVLVELQKVIESGWLGMGALVQSFETAIREYIGCHHCVAVNTGTSALHLALEAAEVRGKEVIVPSMTYAATVQAILMAGGIPVFAECLEEDLNLCVDDALQRISCNTRAIVPVHYAGKAVEMDRLLQAANENEIVVVEDAAHAFGSTYKGRRIGSFGHMTCFSFDPIKTITCGEGGAICTASESWASRMATMRVLGISKNTWDRYKSERPWLYEVDERGYRYHMSNINAAIGINQMADVESTCERRREIADAYTNALGSIPGVALLEHDLSEVVPFCYTIRLLERSRDDFMRCMQEQKIGVSVLYHPNHLQPHFAQYSTTLPVTERLSKQHVSIPLYPSMGDSDIRAVTAAVADFCEYGLSS